jgi:hypothetical protein
VPVFSTKIGTFKKNLKKGGFLPVDTVVSPNDLTLQEQINLLNKRLEALEKRQARHQSSAPRATLPPLSPEQKEAAEQQIMPFLATLPDGEAASARRISQQTTGLRRLGTWAIHRYLQFFVECRIVTKTGTGRSACYTITKIQT